MSRTPGWALRMTALAGLLCLLMASALANDQQRTSTPTHIRLQVQNGCLLNGSPTSGGYLGALHFGSLYHLGAPVSATTTVGNGSIRLRCTPGTTARILLGSGLHGSSVNDRRMRHATLSSHLHYQLYTSSTRQTVWDDVVGMAVVFTADVTQTFPVYGWIPVQATPLSGAYADTVVVTIQY